jgi:hypothetical protein
MADDMSKGLYLDTARYWKKYGKEKVIAKIKEL